MRALFFFLMSMIIIGATECEEDDIEKRISDGTLNIDYAEEEKELSDEEIQKVIDGDDNPSDDGVSDRRD